MAFAFSKKIWLHKYLLLVPPIVCSYRARRCFNQSSNTSLVHSNISVLSKDLEKKGVSSSLMGLLESEHLFHKYPESKFPNVIPTSWTESLLNLREIVTYSLSHLETLILNSRSDICPKSLFSVKAASYFSLQKNFIANIVEKAGPAVVFIEIKGRHPVSGKRVTIANGSGFIVRSNGLILTNAHVVANKSTVNVKLHDGSNYEGHVITLDPVADLATVKINTDKKLTTIPLGKSNTIRPGEFVAAMGSPLSLHKTATIGIVSSYLRGSKELGMSNSNMEYIQTDATIGLGNSGGPLVNLDGKAIGINTLKLTEGISFAIPTDYALPLLEKADILISKADAVQKPNYLPNGKDSTKRRYVGFTMLPLTVPIIMELKDKYHEFPEVSEGVLIHKVVVSSPAYSAGLHAGDIIININGKKVASSADVYSILEKSETLDVTVFRGKHRQSYTVNTESI
ncbi:serine protease HTRA2, mitochondrial [Biomphalaria glabrata]|nr:serine protease HTRA2, mitochondrial [Biomphalaria glabrata]